VRRSSSKRKRSFFHGFWEAPARGASAVKGSVCDGGYASCMEALVPVILVVLVLSGPLSYFFGADSRTDDPRGWWPASRR